MHAAQIPPAPKSAMKKILIVEDDEALAAAYVARFQAEGFLVTRVANGEAALAAATKDKPDLILLDVMLPRVNGFDVLDILRNTPETQHLHIIVLSALGQMSDRKRAEALGVDDYLVKSQATLADIVERVKNRLSA
jgi:DNA-binding response OmpR family regulator